MAVWASAPPQQSDGASATAARDPRFRIVMAPTLAGALTAGPASGAVAPKVTTLPSEAPPDTCSGVQTGPGATPLTRMPFGPSCLASDFTKFIVAALVWA